MSSLPGEARAAEYPRPAYAWYVVAILLTANLSCYLARMVIILLVQPINRDLGISDTQMSLLQGAAFSIFFVLCGLPLGWLVDRRGRRNILIGAVVAWSVMAIFCGLATSYGQLFAARIGVGIGEAALTPAALSIIADYFPPERRGRAMAVYYMGALFGTGGATTIGGAILRGLDSGMHVPFLESFAPWQSLFILSGLPGFAVALLMLTVREPVRREAAPAAGSLKGAPKDASALRFLAGKWRSFLPLYGSLTLMQFSGFAASVWIIPMLVRRDHMTTPDAGTTYGLMMIVFGVLASVFGGVIGDRLTMSARVGGRFRAMIVCNIIFLPGIVVMAVASTPLLAAIGLMFEVLGVCMAASMMYAILQEIVPNQYRGQALALLSMTSTLVGATLGPTSVALVTDRIFHDPAMVGYSIILVTVPATLAGLALTIGGLASYSRERRALHSATAARQQEAAAALAAVTA